MNNNIPPIVSPEMQSNSIYMPTVKEPKEKREYSLKENIFAWMCYVLSYLFCLSIPISDNPLGAFVVIVLMFVATFAFLVIKGKKIQLMSVVVALSAITVSLCLVLTSNDFLHFFAFLYSLVAYCYFLYSFTSERKFCFADRILIDFVKAIFVLPFHSLGEIFVALFCGKSNKSGKFVLKVLLGVVIAIVPTMIVFALLSYDSGFSKLMENIFSFEAFDIVNHIVSLVFAVPVSAYIYGIFISSTDKKCEEMLTPSKCKKTMSTLKIAPAVTVLTAVLPILFIYVMFFVSQWGYYVSGFTGVLPKDFSYAEYAREGFFQLCIVSVINLVIIIAISLFLKTKKNKPSVILKTLSIIISVFTLVLISTAVAKMVMYIDCYGLTQKRVYSSWLMLVLAVVFVMIIIKQFLKKLRLIALSLAVLVVMFTALAVCGVDEIIAEYNVDRYIDGTLTTVDIEALNELGDAAVPSMVRVYDILLIQPYAKMSDTDKDLFFDVRDSLSNKGIELKDRENLGENDVWSYTVPAIKAQKALEKTLFY